MGVIINGRDESVVIPARLLGLDVRLELLAMVPEKNQTKENKVLNIE